MEQERFYFRVGIFVTIVITALIITVTWFTTSRHSQGTTPYAIYFQDAVNGLSLGSNVELKGINVGTVRDITFAADKTDTILVLADIIKTAPIRNDTIASLRLKGITGTSVISLESTGEDPAPIERQPGEKYLIIKSEKSSLEKVFTSIPGLIDDLTKLGKQGQKFLSDENIAEINSVTMELRNFLAEGKTTMREIKMLSKSLRDDPSQILHGPEYKGYKVEK